MSTLTTIASQALTPLSDGASSLAKTPFTTDTSALAFSIVDFLENTQDMAKLIIGLLVALVGIIVMGWSVIQLLMKLVGSQGAQQKSWFLIIAAFFIGGAMAVGGSAWALMDNIGQGGRQTLDELGNGFAIPITHLPVMLR